MNNASIAQGRLSRFLAEAHLRSGAGKGANGKIDVCFIQGANWLAGGDGKSDSHPCIDPVIRGFGIRLNDASQFGEWRDDLKPFTPRIVGTNRGEEVSRKRGFMCADWAVRVIAPMAFDFWAELVPARADEARPWAKKLREVAPIVDVTSARAGREVALGARAAAAARAVAYADSATDAATAARAAAAARAVAYAVADAAAAAVGAAVAYAVADAAAAAATAARAAAAGDAAASAAAAGDADADAAAAGAADAVAYAVADAAAAAATAASAAAAGDADADAAGDADADAAAAGDADAAARSKADAFSRSMWNESLRFLGELIAVTEVAA